MLTVHGKWLSSVIESIFWGSAMLRIGVFAMVMSAALQAGGVTLWADGGCGCAVAPHCCPPAARCQTHCRHHHHHHHCWAPPPPTGNVVGSMAAPTFMTTTSAVPLAVMSDFAMMNAVRPVSLIQAAPAMTASCASQQSSTQSCAAGAAATAEMQAISSANNARINDIEDRVEALRKRVNTLQGSIDDQTRLLQTIVEKLDKKG